MTAKIVSFFRRWSIAIVTLASIALFWIGARFIPPETNRDIWIGVSIFTMVIVVTTWSPETYRIYRYNKTTGASLMILAIALVSLILLESRSFAWLSYYLGRPDWLANSSVPAFIAFQVAAVGALILVAVWKQQNESGVPNGPYLRQMLIAGAIGVFIAGAAFGLAVGAVLGPPR